MGYNLQQKAEIVKLYYKHKYPKILQDVLKKQYQDNKVLSRFQILRIVKKFERKGSIKDTNTEILVLQKSRGVMRTLTE